MLVWARKLSPPKMGPIINGPQESHLSPPVHLKTQTYISSQPILIRTRNYAPFFRVRFLISPDTGTLAPADCGPTSSAAVFPFASTFALPAAGGADRATAAMDKVLTATEQQTLVASFLEIAVGQTADTARQFLQVWMEFLVW